MRPIYVIAILILSACATKVSTTSTEVRNPAQYDSGGGATPQTPVVRQPKVFLLSKLDLKKSCQSPFQKEIGQNALDWFNAFKKDDVKWQVSLFSPDFLLFHSALAKVAMDIDAAKAAGKLPPGFALPPFTNGVMNSGPVTMKNYVEAISFIGANNILSQHLDVPTRVDCVGKDTVVVTVAFSGVQVVRDAQGYIQYKAPYSAQVIKAFAFDTATKLVKRYYTDFDSAVSAASKKFIADQVAAGVPPLAKEESTRTTYQELVDKYHLDLRR